MARIGGKDTRPERVVRSMLHAEGYRFRKHAIHLPGSPDVAFTKRRKAIFVHGCFWHRHEGCLRAPLPASRVDFWTAKFEKTRQRDTRTEAALRHLGWDVLVIWECDIKRTDALRGQLKAFLGPVLVKGASAC